MIYTTIIRAIVQRNTNLLFNEFHTTCSVPLDQRWRKKRGLTANPNKFGALTNLPDYSFTDGRPVPLGGHQMNRLQKHCEYAKKIIQLVGEIDRAVEKHANTLKVQQEQRQKILASKLKPKGHNLIESA